MSMSETIQRRKLTIADLRPIQRIEAPPPMPEKAKAKPPKAAKPKPPPAPPRASGEKTAAQIARRKRYRRKHSAQPSWPEIAAMHATLAEHYPAVFAEARPLAIGIHRQILTELGCEREKLSAALHYWVAQSAYLRAVADGTHRHGLDGAPVAELTEAERADATNRLRQRGQR
jgi:hypothetical protein